MKTSDKTVKKGIGFCATGLGSNVCDIDVDDQGKILRIRPYHFDETTDMARLNPWKIEARGQVLDPGTKTTISPIQLTYKKRVYSKNRILHPMKRVDWDPNGERNPQNRGKSGYVQISWDEALDIIADEIDALLPRMVLSLCFCKVMAMVKRRSFMEPTAATPVCSLSFAMATILSSVVNPTLGKVGIGELSTYGVWTRSATAPC